MKLSMLFGKMGRVVLGLTCLIALVGCGSEGGLDSPMGTVSGKVTQGGMGLGNVTVTFVGVANGETASAITGSDGSYSLRSGNGSSVPVGDYQIAVTPGELPINDPAAMLTTPAPAAPPSAIPDQYRNAQASGLTATVKAGSNADVNFDLQ